MQISRQELNEDLKRMMDFAAVAFVALIGVIFVSIAAMVGCGAFRICRWLIQG